MRLPPILLIVVAGVTSAISSCTTKSDPAPLLSREALMDPASCVTCHKDHYSQWSGSMHAYAGVDPVFLAMNKRGQRETNGALGTFCVNCHAPVAVAMGATKDGLNLAELPASMKGVTCFFCHSVDRVDGTHNNPLHLADDNVIRGQFRDPVKNTAHNATYSPLIDRDQAESATLCGACHDIATQHGANIERTFSEWQGTIFSRHTGGPGDQRVGATCSQCHMNESKDPAPIAQAPNVFARRTHSHEWPGVDLAVTPDFPNKEAQRAQVEGILSTTVQSAICVMPLGPKSSALRVILDTVATGHSFPSGSVPDRRAWIEVVAYKAGAVIYQSGVVPDGGDVLKINDPDLWLFRDCLFDDQGKQVSMFWHAASFESNSLPGLTTFDNLDPEYYKTHVIQNFPRNGTLLPDVPDRVTLRLRMRALGVDLLDELVASNDLASADRDELNKAPTYTLGTHGTGSYGGDAGTIDPYVEWTQATAAAQGAVSTYVDPTGAQVTCVTTTNFKSNATRTPATNHTKCGPP